MSYHLIPLNSARRSQVFSLSRSLAAFPLHFSRSRERCALVTLLADASVSWLYWSAEKPWASFAVPKEALEVFYRRRYCLEHSWKT